MATNFPGSIDSFTNPTSGDTLDSPSHAAQHANINDAMVAVQTRLGTGADPIGTWTTYTPTVTNLTLGTGGSVTGRYAVINKTAFLELVFVLGTGASASGLIQLGVPSGLAPNSTNFFGRGMSRPTGAGTFYWHTLRSLSTSIAIYVDLTATASTSLGATSATVPATWASGGTFLGSIVYEVA